MAAPKKTWKNRERKIAGAFGAKRTPLSGSNSGHNTHSDSLHPTLYLECKYRARHSVLTLYRDTAKKAKAEGKTPVVALAEKGKPGFWLLLKAEDLKEVAASYKADISSFISPTSGSFGMITDTIK